METQEDLTTLRVEKRLAHPPEDVWQALADVEEASKWMPNPYTVIEPRVDGQVEIEGPIHITGRILTWDPPRVFEHEFLVAPNKMTPAGESAVLRYEIAPEKKGCILTVTLTKLTADSARIFTKGLPSGFVRLEAYLDAQTRNAV